MYPAWKDVIKAPEKQELLKDYLFELKQIESPAAEMAIGYGIESKKIGMDLIHQGVAASIEDVNKVMMMGFYHAYGPINDFFE